MIVTRTTNDGAKRYQVRVDVRHHDGRRRVSLGTFSRKRDAQEVERSALTRMASGLSPRRTPAMTFRDLCGDWTSGLVVRDTTRADYAAAVSRLCGVIGDRPVTLLDEDDVRECAERLISLYSPHTVRKTMTRLKQILTVGVERGYAPRVPAFRITLPHPEPRALVVVSSEQVRALLDEVDDWYRPLLLVCVTCGLRQGECFGLRWGDLHDGTLHVRVQLTNGRLGPLKTPAARRDIPLPDVTLAALEAHRERAFVNRLDLMFTTPVGTPIHPSNFNQRILAPATLAAGLDVTMHDLRHTFVSVLVDSGAPVKVVQELAGHTDVRTTLGIYTHLLGPEKAAAARVVGDWVGHRRDTRKPANDEKPENTAGEGT